MTIKVQVLAVALLVALTVVMTAVGLRELSVFGMEKMTQQAEAAVGSARFALEQRGAPAVVDGQLVFGDLVVNNNSALIDAMAAAVDLPVVTVFQLVDGRFVRIATTARDANGQRSVGTPLQGPAAEAMQRGVNYTGLNPIQGRDHIASYQLVRDANQRVIGAVGVARPIEDLEAAQARNTTTFALVGFGALVVAVMVLTLYLWPIGKTIGAVSQAIERLARRDMTMLTDSLGRVANGDVQAALHCESTPVANRRQDEIGRLADAYNLMVANLRQTEESYRSMTVYLRDMASAARTIATGDLAVTVTPRSSDDVLGTAFVQMGAYLAEMADAAERIARGDLSQTVELQSAADALGAAFRSMQDSLRDLVVEVQQVANDVARGSEQLASASQQSASVVGQVSQAMQGVSAGAQNQSNAAQVATNAAEAVGEGARSVASRTAVASRAGDRVR
ncbi:MAG: Cache 3/Cache 2 fusion domain-containing protein, partial [Dehalococcoidia bacterium]|nr:Cache 3/Cache 2 fusion domain-containing protein [Dehalococcoidia bacterium]